MENLDLVRGIAATIGLAFALGGPKFGKKLGPPVSMAGLAVFAVNIVPLLFGHR